MSDKWKWALLIWHGWRAAVWFAEKRIRTGLRLHYAEAMHGYHHYSHQELCEHLHPRPPVDEEAIFEEFKKTKWRHK